MWFCKFCVFYWYLSLVLFYCDRTKYQKLLLFKFHLILRISCTQWNMFTYTTFPCLTFAIFSLTCSFSTSCLFCISPLSLVGVAYVCMGMRLSSSHILSTKWISLPQQLPTAHSYLVRGGDRTRDHLLHLCWNFGTGLIIVGFVLKTTDAVSS